MNEAKSTFTVIIPSKNRKDELLRAVQSCDIHYITHIIIIDDYSSEPLPKINVANKSVQQVRNTKPLGALESRLIGFRLAVTDFCVFLDSDDELKLVNINLVKSLLATVPVVYGNTERLGRTIDRAVPIDYHKYLYKNLCVAPFSGLYINKTLCDIQNIATELKAWQDDEFILQVTSCVAPVHINEVTHISNVSAESISSNIAHKAEGLGMLLKKYRSQIISTNGSIHYYIWQYRYFILMLESLNHKYIKSAALKILLRALRKTYAPFFDCINA